MSVRAHAGWGGVLVALATAAGIGFAEYRKATVPQDTVDRAILSLLDALGAQIEALAVCEADLSHCCDVPVGLEPHRDSIPDLYGRDRIAVGGL